MAMWENRGTGWRNLVTGELVEAFIPGTTRPSYVETADFTGQKNVGAFGSLTTYDGPIVGGLGTLSDAGLYENILFPCALDIRSNVILRNCRQVIPSNFSGSATRGVSLLNGTGLTDVLFENFESHNRSQRPMNGIMGRNFVIRESVLSGYVDPISESDFGSAPNTGYGFLAEDNVFPSVAMWYSPTINPVIHGSDTSSHSDTMQKNTQLSVVLRRNVMATYASEFIGTGTPGSGSDAGNTYVPPSGYNFIAPQAQMETWRNQRTAWTTPSQSMFGDARRLWTDGSMAGVMLNLGNITIDGNWFGGGTVQINAMDPDISASSVHIANNTFHNDMLNGPGSRSTTPTTKGYAVLALTAHTFGTYTNNKWADGTTAAITRA